MIALCNVRKSIIVLITIVVQIVSAFSVASAATMVIDPNQNYFSISGSVDLKPMNKGSSLQSKDGFKVQALGTDLFTMTDKDGYYELKVPVTQSVYSIKVSKSGYLEREITRYTIDKETKEFEKSPINKDSKVVINQMWAGDIKKDNAINMLDVIELAKSFNSKVEDIEYNSCADLNCDSVINLSDVMIIAQNFNKTSDDYFDTKTFIVSVKKAIEAYIFESKDWYFERILPSSVDSIVNTLRVEFGVCDGVDCISYGPYLKFDYDYRTELSNTGFDIYGVTVEIHSNSRRVEVFGNEFGTEMLSICDD